MELVNAKVDDRKVVEPAIKAAKEAEKQGKGNEGIFSGAAIELKDGTIITGKNSPLMHATSSLNLEETMIALGISAISNPSAQMAVQKLKELRNCEVHLTHIPTPGDEAGLRKLHMNLTCDPAFSTKSLFLRE